MITASPHGPIETYLPHRPPMLLIDDIISVTDQRFVCHTAIHADCVFAIDGRVHPSAMIEFVAQTCAAGVGVLAARTGNPPKVGLIMGCREMAFEVDSFAVGDELRITADKLFGQTQMAAFACTVERGAGAVSQRDAASGISKPVVQSWVVCATIQLSVVDADLTALSDSSREGRE